MRVSIQRGASALVPADQHAQERAGRDGRNGGRDGQRRAMRDAGQEIAPELIRAEPVRGAGG